jgi:uncharacterized delta-60 repeat protein
MSIRSIFGFGGRRTLQSAFYASLCAAFLASGTLIGAVNAAPGDLDNTFGASLNGRVTTDFGTATDDARAMVVQPNGKIVVAGTCNNDLCVARYNPDGTPDNSFNGNGRVTTGFFISLGFNLIATFDEAFAVAVQPDEKVVVVGGCKSTANGFRYFCMTRYNVNGTLDTTFNGGGVKTFPAASTGDEAARSVAIQADGKIVIAGSCGDRMCLARVNTDGTLDTAFPAGGAIRTSLLPVSSASDVGSMSVLVQDDQKIALVWPCEFTPNDSRTNVCIARFDTSGNLDSGFDLDGFVGIFPFAGGNSKTVGGALQPDGKILAGVNCDGYLCAARFNSNGGRDGSFGTNGADSLDDPTRVSTDSTTGIAVQPDGKLLLVKYCSPSGSRQVCIGRMNSDGSPDTSFGTSGRTNFFIAGATTPYAIALQPDGKIVVAGTCSGVNGSDFCLARLEGGPFGYRQCSLDIDGDGQVQATTDTLIATRIALGVTGPTVLAGINLAGKPRSNWNDIRKFLVTQCGMSIAQ